MSYEYKSGFCGHDSMRDKAMKEFGHELRRETMHVPESNSSKARTNMPLYKKGGKVHGLTKMQTDLYIPTRSKQHHQKQVRFEKVEHKADGGMMGVPDIAARIQQANQMLSGAAAPVGVKRGGKVHHGHRRVHKANGGMLGMSEMGNRDLVAGRNAVGLKHGGKAHHGRVKKDIGGILKDIGNAATFGIPGALGKARGGRMGSGKNQDDSQRMLRGEPLQKGYHGHGLRHGGRAHRKSEGGPMRGENPGMGASNNYESNMKGEHEMNGAMRHGGKVHRKSEGGPMRGEHPTHHMSRNNYESNMRGEHGHHSTMHRGGKMHRAEGGRMLAEGGYAAGGVGKIRHRQMTMGGKQISRADKFRHE
jgi:hypothetical protein